MNEPKEPSREAMEIAQRALMRCSHSGCGYPDGKPCHGCGNRVENRDVHYTALAIDAALDAKQAQIDDQQKEIEGAEKANRELNRLIDEKQAEIDRIAGIQADNTILRDELVKQDLEINRLKRAFRFLYATANVEHEEALIAWAGREANLQSEVAAKQGYIERLESVNDGAATEIDRLKDALADCRNVKIEHNKADKMHPAAEVMLGECPECHKFAIHPTMCHCMACGWGVEGTQRLADHLCKDRSVDADGKLKNPVIVNEEEKK